MFWQPTPLIKGGEEGICPTFFWLIVASSILKLLGRQTAFYFESGQFK